MIDFAKIKETFQKERVLSWSNLLIMTITFLVLGVFLTTVFITQSTLQYLEQQTQVTAFFRDDFAETSILDLKTQLEQDERIAKATYVSKQEALKIFADIHEDEPLLLEGVSANTLPASLKVQTNRVSDLQFIAEELSANPGVEGVKFFEDVVSQFQKIAGIIYIAGFSLTAVFLFVSYSAVVITLRTYINRKGTELEILKLVGASNEYVQRPIISQGLFFSFASSFLATLILLVGAVIASFLGLFGNGLLIPFTTGIRVSLVTLSAALGIILLLSGFLLGYVGSRNAVKKYLKY